LPEEDDMRTTKVPQEILKMRFGEAYEGWKEGRRIKPGALNLEVCERSFLRYLRHYERRIA
jgi:hypothetical protein